MLNNKLLAFTSALLLGAGSLMGQITVNEEDNKKVESIKVDGPSDNGDIKRAKADSLRCFFAPERNHLRLMFTTHLSASRMSTVIKSMALSPLIMWKIPLDSYHSARGDV